MRWPGAALSCALLLSACADREPGPTAKEDNGIPAGAEAVSLLGGAPLFPPELPPEVLQDRQAKLAEARRDYDSHPRDADALIWLGRRTAYLGRYREAIDLYTKGIEAHPGDPRMLRHRGHRFITVRRFKRAIDDLERAAQLIAGTPDRVEPDGLPNARNIPTSTLHSNIWYHLGLAYYLQGDLENALRAYRECMKVSRNPDMLAATTHWLYMTLRRMGRDDEARAVLEPITADMEIIENDGYHKLLLMYKGELSTDELLEQAASGTGIENATREVVSKTLSPGPRPSEAGLSEAPQRRDAAVHRGGAGTKPRPAAAGRSPEAFLKPLLAYGVANWLALDGRAEEARVIWERVVQGTQWAAFGFIAAEADLARADDGGWPWKR